jgi:SAM-dependent methyltransferase
MSNSSILVGVHPLNIGPSVLFRELRAFLTDSYYSEAAVCKRLGLDSSQDYLTLRPNLASPRSIEDPLDLVVRLFLIGEMVSNDELEKWAPLPVLDAMRGLGLVARHSRQAENWYATTALYPAYGIYLVSDRWSSPDNAPIEMAADVVYPAVTINTAHFLETLPDERCESFLDLCSGSGVAALVAASRYARHAWSTDVTESSTRCAEFGRLLNGIENLTVAQGDLYQAAGKRTFDRIAANPPYMPSLRPAEIYAYGGEFGDEVTRRIVEGLPEYLRPGGRFYCVTAGPDRDDEGFEVRMRDWLGSAAGEFDIFFFERRLFEPGEIAHQRAAKTRGGPEEVDAWKKLFAKHGVKNLVYGSLVFQRKTGAGRPVTVRRRKGPRLGTAEIEWLRAWETAAADEAILRRILDAKPLASNGLELRVIHRLRNGELAPQDFTLETSYPFTIECAIQPWAAYLIARCDGKTTARQILGYLKENGVVAAGEPEEEFADFLRVLISGGFLEIEGFRLPPH